MNNLMDTYITFTEKKIKKYMKTMLDKQYDENLVNEDTIDIVLPKFIEFIEDLPLISHNNEFDTQSTTVIECGRNGIKFSENGNFI